jgi:hypothetical protein
LGQADRTEEGTVGQADRKEEGRAHRADRTAERKVGQAERIEESASYRADRNWTGQWDSQRELRKEQRIKGDRAEEWSGTGGQNSGRDNGTGRKIEEGERTRQAEQKKERNRQMEQQNGQRTRKIQ